MARQTRSGVNKSEAIREHLTQNPDASPTEILQVLALRGIETTPGFVSTIKSEFKKGNRGRKKKGTRKAAPGDLSISTLLDAKKLADQLGGVDQARDLLRALSRLSR
jgi:hypothetical protein